MFVSNFWKSLNDPLLLIFLKVRTIMISVIVGLFVFLYFANGFSTLAISSDKHHIEVIFVNCVFYFYFDCSACYCIFKLNRYPFFLSHKYHWFKILLELVLFLYLSVPIDNGTWHVRIGIFYSLKPLLKTK